MIANTYVLWLWRSRSLLADPGVLMFVLDPELLALLRPAAAELLACALAAAIRRTPPIVSAPQVLQAEPGPQVGEDGADAPVIIGRAGQPELAEAFRYAQRALGPWGAGLGPHPLARVQASSSVYRQRETPRLGDQANPPRGRAA
jgi:hypothetical protein